MSDSAVLLCGVHLHRNRLVRFFYQVRISGSLSQVVEAGGGVPKDSILGPILVLISVQIGRWSCGKPLGAYFPCINNVRAERKPCVIILT